MNNQLNSLILDLQAYRGVMLRYRQLLFQVPSAYDIDDRKEIDNYWYKAGDAGDAWEQMDQFRREIAGSITDNLRMQLKLADQYALLEKFEKISQAYDYPPRFG